MTTYSSASFFKKISLVLLGVIILTSFLFPVFADAQAQPSTGPCTITSASFKPLDNQPSWSDKNGNFFLGVDFDGGEGWFQEGGTNIIVSVRTQNCAGKEIGIEIKSNRPDYKNNTISALSGQKFLIEASPTEGYELALQVGEEYCQELTSNELESARNFPLSFLEDNISSDAQLRSTLGLSSGILPGDDSTINVRDTLISGINEYGSIVDSTFGEDGWDLPAFLFFDQKTETYSKTNIVGPFLNYLQENQISKTSFPSPCEFYIKVLNPDSVNGDKDFSTASNSFLRYSCDYTTIDMSVEDICEQGVLWKVLQVNSNIGGLMPIDPSSPCYDPNNPGVALADCQELLAPLPGFGDRVDENLGLGEYINTILQMVIGFMGIIAVLMIIASGVKYMTTENFGGKADAKATIGNAFLGLLIAVSIFIILRTINPDLLNLDVGIDNLVLGDPAEQDASVVSGGSVGAVAIGSKTEQCANRRHRGYWKTSSEKITQIQTTSQDQNNLGSLAGSSIVLKGGTPLYTNIQSSVLKSLRPKLVQLDNKLRAQNIETRLTEVFGPTTIAHGSPCHYFGSCVDLGTINQQYPPDVVEKIIRAADESGLTAHFESSSASTVNKLRKDLVEKNIDACHILNVKHATGDHFSIYEKEYPSLMLK